MKRLIISEISDDFNPDNDILLGLFCLYGKEDIFPKWDSFNIVPDPIQTIDQLRDANEYTIVYANSLMDILADTLNKKYSTDKSIKYWKIILFPWLLHYVQIFWERYQRIQYVKAKYSDIKLTIDLISNKHKWSFESTLDYFVNGALV